MEENYYSSLETVYRDNRKLVFAYIADYSKERIVMEELASRVWAKVWEYDKTILGMEKQGVKRYLRSMVRSTIGDYIRELKKEQALIEKISEHMECIEPWEKEHKRLFMEEMYDYLRIGLSILTDEERLLLQLRFKENYSSKEVGRMLNISENNVRVRQYRIVMKMKCHIQKSIERGQGIYEK